MNLVIVESPVKTKTISKYLSGDYVIRASVGHIRDLPKSNKKAIDIPAGFVPYYEIIKGKEKVVEEIKELSKKAGEIILATDPDREGEAIAWHLTEALGFGNPKSEILNPKVQRIVFHEITKSAIEEALKNPRDIDMNLVASQEARRVLDRLVGYDLSGLIWKKVRYGLSAGRVQSPALRIIMEREREIRAFAPENYWVITGVFETKNKNEITLVCDTQPKNKNEVDGIIKIANENRWQITDIAQNETKRSPKPPFITSTLQQAASSRLGYSPSRAMSIAQKLYEQGLITYMRTDSVNISKEALSQIYKEIEKTFGKEYLERRTYITKSKTSQEAHEAIRPTNIDQRPTTNDKQQTNEQEKLYKLIWERTITSQMAKSQILKTKVSANIIKPGLIPNFSIIGSIMIFPGWLAADTASAGEDMELPKLSKNEPLKLVNIADEGKQTESASRYTEAGLIKELEKREIGRPSTYASIIKTIIDRGYTIKEGRTLRPTDTGEVVSGFLEQNFAKYISDSFTAEMENELDEIAEGKRKYEIMLKNFYTPFSKEIKLKEKTAEKITNLGEAGEEHKCPVCNGPMVIKLSRNGKFLSCKKFPECAGARKINGSIMEGPKETGEICPKCSTGKLIEREGRFGKFIACSNYPKCKFIKKSAEEEAKTKTDVACPKCGGEIVERRGKFGPFFSCSNYPKCDFIMKSRPTGNICPACAGLMMEGTKTIPERCSNFKCPNNRPDKLKK